MYAVVRKCRRASKARCRFRRDERESGNPARRMQGSRMNDERESGSSRRALGRHLRSRRRLSRDSRDTPRTRPRCRPHAVRARIIRACERCAFDVTVIRRKRVSRVYSEFTVSFFRRVRAGRTGERENGSCARPIFDARIFGARSARCIVFPRDQISFRSAQEPRARASRRRRIERSS